MTTKMVRRASVWLIAGFAMIFATAGASYAIGQLRDWNSYQHPLTVHAYGSYGWGYGTWKVSTGSDGTRSRLYSHQALSNADDHKVFTKLTTLVNAGYCLQPEYVSCNQKYYYYDDSDTGHTTCYCWELRNTSTGLTGTADYARGQINVKLDIPWRPDPSSGSTYTQGDDY